MPSCIVIALILHFNALYLENSFANFLLAYPVFLAGTLLKAKIQFLTCYKVVSMSGISILIVSLAAVIIIPFYNDWPRMYTNHYGTHLYLFVLGAAAGIYIVYFIARLIGKKASNGISIISRGNILTLGIHGFFVAALHGAGMLNGYID